MEFVPMTIKKQKNIALIAHDQKKHESHGAAAGGSYRESYKTRQLTQGNWVVQNILGFKEKNTK